MQPPSSTPARPSEPLANGKTTLNVRTGIRSGDGKYNHNQGRLPGLTVRTGIRSGGGKVNHNQSRMSSLTIRTGVRSGTGKLNHNQSSL